MAQNVAALVGAMVFHAARPSRFRRDRGTGVQEIAGAWLRAPTLVKINAKLSSILQRFCHLDCCRGAGLATCRVPPRLGAPRLLTPPVKLVLAAVPDGIWRRRDLPHVAALIIQLLRKLMG